VGNPVISKVRRPGWLGISALLTVAGLAACAAGPADGSSSVSPVEAGAPVSPTALTAAPTPTPDTAQRLAALVDSLTPAQLAGQLIMIGLHDTDPATVLDGLAGQYGIGGVVLLGHWSGAQVQPVADHLAGLATAGIRPYIAADQEGGQIQRVKGDGVDVIPAATVQGTWALLDLAAQARIWGTQLRAAGVDLDLAPVADTVPADLVGQNAPIGLLDRQFGSTPDVTGPHAAAFVIGLTLAREMSCVKHFPGLGRVTENTDNSADGTTDAVMTATDPFLDAYRMALAAHPTMVMISLATYPGLDPAGPAVFSRAIVTDLLRGQLGWSGVVVSDSLSAAAVRGVPLDQRAVQFVEAGGDIAILTSVEQAHSGLDGLVAAMAASPAFTAKVRAAALRVLTMKAAAGLLILA